MMKVRFKIERNRIMIKGDRDACMTLAKEFRGVIRFNGHPFAMRATAKNAAALVGAAESEKYVMRWTKEFGALLEKSGEGLLDRALAHCLSEKHRSGQNLVFDPAARNGVEDDPQLWLALQRGNPRAAKLFAEHQRNRPDRPASDHE